MNCSHAESEWWNGRYVLLGSMIVVPGALAAGALGVTAFPPVGAGLVAAVALAAMALLGLAVLYRSSAAGRMRAFGARLERLDLPAVASTRGGQVIYANSAMRAVCGDDRTDLARMLDHGVEVTPAAIYRLTQAARRLGFGFERTRRRPDGAAVFLAARVVDSDTLVWTVVPPARMPRGADGNDPELVAGALFPRLRVDESGKLIANAAFRRRYAEVEDQPADLLTGSDADAGRWMLLRRRDGATELCGVWSACADDEESRDARHIVILPLHGRDEPPGGWAALDLIPVALMLFDPTGRLLWSNAHAREVTGMELAPGAALADLVEPLGRPVDLLLSDTSSRREMVRLRGAADDTFLHISLTPVTLDNTPGLLAVLSDANELRLLEDKFAQSQKMEAVGKLAGGVAHDFNNVLTAISGHSDLLLLGKDALHPEYSDLMQIRQNTHRAAALVRQLLAFSRKQTLKPALLSVQDVVSDTQYLLDRLIGEKVSLTVEHGAELWPVRADQQQLEQALMNLVVNARDAMPDGGTVTLGTRNLTLEEQHDRQAVEVPAGAYVEISVSDGGAGIPPQLIDRIFDPFFTTKARGEGTGLGLSTVYGIVKQTGGYIFAENRPEGGACFRILLPRAHAQEGEAGTEAPPPPPDRRDLTGKGVVLLVEDEDPVRSFASRALKLRGYDVVEAASAEQAMAFLSEPANHVDVLVSDVVMPGMDGPTFAAEACKMRPGLRVVFVSGYAEDSFRRTMLEQKFLFLPKPFSLTDLTAKVKEALGEAA